MFASQKRIRNGAGIIKSMDQLIRSLRLDIDLQAATTLISLELAQQADSHREFPHQIGDVMVDAESKRAKGIMSMQQHRSFG